MHLRQHLRQERGGILAFSALLLPVFILMGGFVVDVGNWYTHKRQLQNKADAGALAAGYEYLSRVQNCSTDPAPSRPNATAITAVAKQYAGETFNQTINTGSRVTVRVNATSPTAADWSDGPLGQGPCERHAPNPADAISPAGGIWTDVRVRETQIGSLFGGFGLDLNQVDARARVEVKQLVGVQYGGLPFIKETGDQVDCAWAQFVDAGTGNEIPLLGGTPNPVPLTPHPTSVRRFTGQVGGIDFTSTNDIAVQYWMGTRKSGNCSYDPTVAGEWAAISPEVPINYIHVYDNDTPNNNNTPPLLHHFELTSGSCGGRSYVYTTSLDVNTTCTVGFRAEVDSGANTSPTSITVSSSNAAVTSVVSTTGAGGTGVRDYTGQLTFRPNVVDTTTGQLQSYTNVGPHWLRVSWRKTSGRIGNRNCTTGNPCTGVFESGPCGSGCDETILQQTYVADPVSSAPIMTAELVDGTGTPISNSYAADGPDRGAFTVDLTNYGIEQQRTVLIRDWDGAIGNRNYAVDCGQGVGTNQLRNAVRNGCPAPLGVNVRADVCSPQPSPAGYRDCVEALPGNRAGLAHGYMDRFPCTAPNNWIPGVSPANLSSGDPRWAYIFLTSWGRLVNARQSHTPFPIRAFLRIYVTGWDRQGGGPPGPETCAGNEAPPEPYTSQGNDAALWGHFVDVITLDDSVIVGTDPCNATADLVTCKPVLVR
jgi:hypothetical protein